MRYKRDKVYQDEEDAEGEDSYFENESKRQKTEGTETENVKKSPSDKVAGHQVSQRCESTEEQSTHHNINSARCEESKPVSGVQSEHHYEEKQAENQFQSNF